VVNESSGASNLANKNGISVAPNPASEQILIKSLEEAGLQQLTLTDLMGKVLRVVNFEMAASEYSLPLETCATGFYLLSVKTAGGEILQYKISVVR
jgi:hypothetical protein